MCVVYVCIKMCMYVCVCMYVISMYENMCVWIYEGVVVWNVWRCASVMKESVNVSSVSMCIYASMSYMWKCVCGVYVWVENVYRLKYISMYVGMYISICICMYICMKLVYVYVYMYIMYACICV